MEGSVEISIIKFSLIYTLLLIIIFIMKKANVNKSKLLITASIRMTVQLILVGFLLTYIFSNPKPIFTFLFLCSMIAFSIQRVLSSNKKLNKRFKLGIAFSMITSGLFVLIFFVCVIIEKDIFNPQYTIPLSGMIIGNSMTGVSLALKVFLENITIQKKKIDTLINLGASPETILKPFMGNALETALLPTINSMVGMGIIFLPGMMTGQILSGTVPKTAILYQIAIMIAICTSVSLTVFLSLNIGYKTLFNDRNQINIGE